MIIFTIFFELLLSVVPTLYPSGSFMKTYIRGSVIAGIFLLSLVYPTFANWKARVTQNQIKAAKYITQLKNGANPDTIKRPQLRRDKSWKAKQSQKEIAAAMTKAEKLARSGKQNLITQPIFKFNGLSEK